MQPISVDINTAVEMSGLSRSALYKLFKAGEITPKKSGKRTLVMVDDLRRHVENLPAAGA